MNENAEIWTGRAQAYNAYRPHPPTVILDMFTQLIGDEHPRLVVDLGSGTGLSTAIWAERAQQVIGIEPNDDMRQQAEEKREQFALQNVEYQAAVSARTGLPDGCADIVTCSQSLHWMEPETTFAEIARILRPGGLFAAYDYAWPPTINWEAEAAYDALDEMVEKIGKEQSIEWRERGQYWEKEQHLERIKASGRFRYVKEVLVHNREIGDADRFIGLTLSNHIAALLQQGLSEEEVGLDRYKAAVRQALGEKTMPLYFSYHVRIGIK